MRLVAAAGSLANGVELRLLRGTLDGALAVLVPRPLPHVRALEERAHGPLVRPHRAEGQDHRQDPLHHEVRAGSRIRQNLERNKKNT